MFSKLRHPIRSITEPFGKAGLIVAICALVLATTGAAFAAAGLNSKQKKEVTKIAKKYAGKAGAPGAAGSNGTNGAAGAAGKDGTNGTSVTGKAISGAPCPAGVSGVEYTSASGVNTVCSGKNGTNGTTGFTEFLPSGKTETGTWDFSEIPRVGHPGTTNPSISFPIPLEFGIEAANVHIFKGGTAPAGCSFESGFLEAAADNLCIWIDGALGAGVEPAELTAFNPETVEEGSGRTGTILSGSGVPEGTRGFGTWAVTAK